LLLSERKVVEAKAKLEAIAAQWPRDPEIAITLGQVALADQRFADAAAQFERAALLPLPEVWSEAYRNEFAIKIFHNLAMTYGLQSRWIDIKPILGTLIHLTPDNPSYLIRLALAHYHLSEKKEAQALLEKAARMTQGATPAELLMAEVAFSAGQPIDAETAITEARKKYPDNFNVQLWHAEWMLHRGDCDEADESLAIAHRLGASSSRYWIPRGQLLMMRGEFSDAVNAFRKALEELKTEPDQTRHVAIANLLAIALTCAEQNQEATGLAEKNALENLGNPNLVGTLGWIYLKNGKIKEAEELLNHVIDMSPLLSSDLNFFIADLYRAMGNPTLADRYLEKTIEGKRGIFVMKAYASTHIDDKE